MKDRLCGLVVRVSGYRSRGSGFDSRSFQIFWEAAGQERGPLSLMRTTEELLGWKSSGSHLEINDRGNPLRWPRNTLYPQNWHCFANKRRSLGRHNSLADQSHGVQFFSSVNESVLILRTNRNLSYEQIHVSCNILKLLKLTVNGTTVIRRYSTSTVTSACIVWSWTC
jgi:hypothetical protein